ncbi:MAG TPA: hypothetical protein VE604_15905 [Candidatus Polarisedimenticolia bacterium]|nr:hypothetical protein [Candidatus Polarisedimenticolia bacterium]
MLITTLLKFAFAIKLGAAVFLLAGVAVAVYGTYLMTTAYHPFKTFDLIKNVIRTFFRLSTFRWRKAKALITDVSNLEVNKEDRAKSLMGVYFLFLSFVLQTVGAVLAVLDVVISLHATDGH